MGIARDEVYIWPTWLTKLLIGDSSCEWSAWFKAHYQFKKLGEKDWTSFRITHTELINKKRVELQDKGYRVLVERQAEFRLKGKTATLHGRPDLVAVSQDEARLYELETSSAYPSHKVQLMIYMYGLSFVVRNFPGTLHPEIAQLKGRPIDGVISYEDGSEVKIPSTAIDEAFIKKVTQLLGRVGGSSPATKVPSALECGYCNIPQAECPERAAPDQVLEAVTEDF